MTEIRENSERRPKGKRGGDVKKAPHGYYTAGEAQQRLAMNASTFRYYVNAGRINRIVPPGRKEGYYSRKEINQLAVEMALFLHTGRETRSIVTRTARPEDAEGVVNVLEVFGWKTASAEQRRSWYKINPFIDYVVVANDEVVGYINAAPYIPETMRDMLSGKKRSWQVQPQEFYRYEPGTYDLYIGIATRKDIPGHTQRFGFPLIAGFLSFLEDMARQGVYIHRLYAASDQPDGIKLCTDLGFQQLPKEEGDLFGRFMLDLETSESLFAKRYRESIRK